MKRLLDFANKIVIQLTSSNSFASVLNEKSRASNSALDGLVGWDLRDCILFIPPYRISINNFVRLYV